MSASKHRDRTVIFERVADELIICDAREALSALGEAGQIVGIGARRLHAIESAMRHEDFNELSQIKHCEADTPHRHRRRCSTDSPYDLCPVRSTTRIASHA
jgi:hypothetical protein